MLDLLIGRLADRPHRDLVQVYTHLGAAPLHRRRDAVAYEGLERGVVVHLFDRQSESEQRHHLRAQRVTPEDLGDVDAVQLPAQTGRGQDLTGAQQAEPSFPSSDGPVSADCDRWV